MKNKTVNVTKSLNRQSAPIHGSHETFIKRIIANEFRETPSSELLSPTFTVPPIFIRDGHGGIIHSESKKPDRTFHLFSPNYDPKIDASSGSSEDRIGIVKSLFSRVSAPLGYNEVPEAFNPDDAYALLNEEFPWFEEANHIAVSWLASSRRNRHFHLPNIALDGKPGIGKTRWARRVASMINPVAGKTDDTVGVVSLAGMSSVLNIIGCDQSYVGSKPGLWYEVIARSQSANPIIILDEIDKAEENVAHALLSFLAPETSSKFFCPFFRTEVNLSKVNYVATTNDFRAMPEPLQSRLEIIHCRVPTLEEVKDLIPTLASEIMREIGETVPFSPDMNLIANAYHEDQNIRTVRSEVSRQIREIFWKASSRPRHTPHAPHRIGFTR